MGALIDLSDANSVFLFDPTPPHVPGKDWVINGSSILSEISYFYRFQDIDSFAQGLPGQPYDYVTTLQGPTLVTQKEPAWLRAEYSKPDAFTLEIAWTLMGAPPGTWVSSLSEHLRVTNVSPTRAMLFVLRYAQFTLSEGGKTDSINCLQPYPYQWAGSRRVAFSFSGENPIHRAGMWEGGDASEDIPVNAVATPLRNKQLYDLASLPNPGLLRDSMVSFASQWSVPIPPGGCEIMGVATIVH